MRRVLRDSRGFTLIELLVATTIFLIGAVGLIHLLTTSMAANTSSRNQTEAANLAQDRLEQIRNTAYASIVSGSDGPLTATKGTGGVFNRSWTVDTAAIANAKQVTVTVSWQDHGSRQVQLQTVIRND